MATTNVRTAPVGLPKKPPDQAFKKPVSWLLGPQLIASLKMTAVYVAFKNKLDPRDWMEAEVCSFRIEDRLNKNCSEDEYWFDFIADTGDGQKATYSIAYLCLSKLWVADPPARGADVRFNRSDIPANATLLPRGEFLFIGGDTSYHMADYTTLAERFQAPFFWAYQDVENAGGIDANDPRRPILGLPANHDYYDFIDGFNRQLRKPTSEEGEIDRLGLYPQLSVPGFKRVQQATYTAIKLPFEWWLWGLDNEVGKLDVRQQEFFKKTCDEMCGGKAPDKVIVATPEPTTVLGKLADPKGRLAQTFKDLGLERSFLGSPPEELPAHKCRLDISGDTHHYTRYWGPDSSDAQKNTAPSANNYASVVSGLGGAFFHPSHVNFGQVQQQVVYPSPEESRRAISARLFDLVNLVRGGYVALLGAFMAFVIFFGATIPRSTKTVVDMILYKWLGVAAYPETSLGSWFPALVWPEKNFAESAGLDGWAVFWRVGLLALSTGLIITAVVCAKLLVGLSRREKEEWSGRYSIAILLSLVAALVSLFFGIKDFWIHTGSLSPFKCSVLVLLAATWSAASITAGIIYSEWVNKQASKGTVNKIHFWLLWSLVVIGIAMLSAGVLKFGKYPFAYLFSDTLFAFVAIGVFAGLILIGFFVGGEQQGVGGKIGFAVLGLWHGVLQVAVPLLLVRVGSWRAWLAAMLTVLVFAVVGNQLARRGLRWLLLVAWLAHGVLVLWLPFALREAAFSTDAQAHVLKLVVAALLGGLMSCVWLGWYMAVSLEFNGHYSEAGGAARIEEYKEFVRIRLTKNTLTAYVVAVDQPLSNGADLKMKIVDVFQLRASE
ncbi:MAG TPA: hypothetical protein VNS63_16420 [Blastocatellia bacterium]|nr:hypothetical protein [Blastocatellia bacterium]